MSQFTIAQAKAHFSELVDKAVSGEEVIIARDNKPLLRLAPISRTSPISGTRQPGSAKGLILHMAPDFDETPQDFADYV